MTKSMLIGAMENAKQTMNEIVRDAPGKCFVAGPVFSRDEVYDIVRKAVEGLSPERAQSIEGPETEVVIKADGRLVPRYAKQDSPDRFAPDATTMGQDKSSIPDCAYYSEGNFYSHLTGHGMGQAFFNTWYKRWHEFPKRRQIPQLMVKPTTDYRVVPRGLLEHCLGVLEFYGERHIDPSLTFAISQLKASLEIEKPQPLVKKNRAFL